VNFSISLHQWKHYFLLLWVSSLFSVLDTEKFFNQTQSLLKYFILQLEKVFQSYLKEMWYVFASPKKRNIEGEMNQSMLIRLL
jgi:hypothetical protein